MFTILVQIQSAASDKVYQLLAHGRWFSSSTPASSTKKTGRHDIAEMGVKHQNEGGGALRDTSQGPVLKYLWFYGYGVFSILKKVII
jgi:hypothetical protein